MPVLMARLCGPGIDLSLGAAPPSGSREPKTAQSRQAAIPLGDEAKSTWRVSVAVRWLTCLGAPMSVFSRVQKIAAMLAISLVVVITLIVVAVSGGDSESVEAEVSTPAVAPTAVPLLEKRRVNWSEVTDTIRGAGGTLPPVPCPFVDERDREPNNFLSLTPGLTFVCDQEGLQANPIAPGRVVMRITQAPLNSEQASLVANGNDGPWIRAAAYGPFVAIDHGPLNGVSNVTTIYAGLTSINPNLSLGQQVDSSTALGTIGGRILNGELVAGVLTFELISDDTRFGSDPLRSNPPPASAGAGFADMLTEAMALPITTCNLPWGVPDLNVGAPREYRSGTHNGLDFNCGTIDHRITAAADGEVLFVVNDYVNPTVEDRNAVLRNAEAASDTPFWTLAMLYGNFAVVAHDIGPTSDRVITIYAHLSEIDPNIVTGRIISQGELIGFAGNTGTSTAAGGTNDTHSSVHLHWELHVNDRAVGYLGNPVENEILYRQMLCSPTVEGAQPIC